MEAVTWTLRNIDEEVVPLYDRTNDTYGITVDGEFTEIPKETFEKLFKKTEEKEKQYYDEIRKRSDNIRERNAGKDLTFEDMLRESLFETLIYNPFHESEKESLKRTALYFDRQYFVDFYEGAIHKEMGNHPLISVIKTETETLRKILGEIYDYFQKEGKNE